MGEWLRRKLWPLGSGSTSPRDPSSSNPARAPQHPEAWLDELCERYGVRWDARPAFKARMRGTFQFAALQFAYSMHIVREQLGEGMKKSLEKQ